MKKIIHKPNCKTFVDANDMARLLDDGVLSHLTNLDNLGDINIVKAGYSSNLRRLKDIVKEELFEHTYTYIDYAGLTGDTLGNMFDSIILTVAERTLYAYLNTLYPEIKKIGFIDLSHDNCKITRIPVTILALDREKGHPIAKRVYMHVAGRGPLKLFSILLAVICHRNSGHIVVVENIEDAFHTKQYLKVLEMLAEVAVSMNVKLILTTEDDGMADALSSLRLIYKLADLKTFEVIPDFSKLELQLLEYCADI